LGLRVLRLMGCAIRLLVLLLLVLLLLVVLLIGLLRWVLQDKARRTCGHGVRRRRSRSRIRRVAGVEALDQIWPI